MCRPECNSDSECPQNKACRELKCQDVCVGKCGNNAQCQMINHEPICSCTPGFTGNPFVYCIKEEKNPCNPSPCGPNSECHKEDNRAVCSCRNNYFGSPPKTMCRPECNSDSECPQNKACRELKCQDVCVGKCGNNAQCQMINHEPICSCKPGFTGNPFVYCIKEEKNPCNPSPCGPNSECHKEDNRAVCSCRNNYFGSPPKTMCRPECNSDSECPQNKACRELKCQDVCVGKCGNNAQCQMINHEPICSCKPGFTGNPFVYCIKEEKNPCNPSPCGPNSECHKEDNHAVCSCQNNYFGSPPKTMCRPECNSDSECPQNKACRELKCQDVCVGKCGNNAQCQMINHEPICSCKPGFTGNPFVYCIKEEKNPCNPSPCGPNSECHKEDNRAVCSCQNNYFGSPPMTMCTRECNSDSECPQNKACRELKCQDVCIGKCGNNAQCQMINHEPICSCKPGFTGNPFVYCIKEEKNPCNPSPCGPNSECHKEDNRAVCSCQKKYFGSPPTTVCRPECNSDSECPQNKACLDLKCLDVCVGKCGNNAQCQMINHEPICSCQQGFTGNPFVYCIKEEGEQCTPFLVMLILIFSSNISSYLFDIQN
ncbi:neurogenic locus notch homolog protein 1-like [Planococcus citri]|uniref:neurogenic locus notch homolog protein 1-like n=1 Tax=Planococcus citri TaxID=170843 RepID=UPI0031F804A7